MAILCSCSPRLRRSPASGAARHICMPLRSMCTQAQCCVSHCHTIPTRILPFPDPQDNHGLEIPEVLDEGYISLAPRHPPFDTHLSCPSHVAPESTVQKPNGRFGPDRLWTVMRITVATISRANRSSQRCDQGATSADRGRTALHRGACGRWSSNSARTMLATRSN